MSSTRIGHLLPHRFVHLGRFVAPPMRVEEMDASETYGQTGGMFVKVGAVAGRRRFAA
ncbi:hypothetical protein [Polyangium jinanense]|uniref:Uncharacterized protein n=1 Tax=Polyangium jinanense TaxID=2829994 RepID=A0A9X4AZ36_9BACT|nr:hypothetical protein [Polyangium jinanense]MDC3961570.1 hypothetical protein [Polyangium jinanense]MDC3987935.1 hypothetical protein [Polyangium jinanense]